METRLIVFTAPSGAGKTTIVRHLLAEDKRLAFSISACTREQRYGEVNGLDYYFMSATEFKKRIANNEFVEYQEVYENQLYGTLKSEIDRLSDAGKHIIFDIDVKGAMNIKKMYQERALIVFVKPPSKEILFERLRNRKTEDKESLRKRLARAAEELNYETLCDRVLLNEDLDQAVKNAQIIVNQFIEIFNNEKKL